MANTHAKLPMPQTEDEAILLLHKSKNKRSLSYKRLEEIRASGLHGARRFARVVLENPHVIIATLADVLKDKGADFGKPLNPSFMDIAEAGLSFDLWGLSTEKVSVFRQLRRNGNDIWFHNLGPVDCR